VECDGPRVEGDVAGDGRLTTAQNWASMAP
jgi:hypothetical protein